VNLEYFLVYTSILGDAIVLLYFKKKMEAFTEVDSKIRQPVNLEFLVIFIDFIIGRAFDFYCLTHFGDFCFYLEIYKQRAFRI
jgi:hypothetical protein